MEYLKLKLERWLPSQLPGVEVHIDPMQPGDKISGIIVWKGFNGLEPIDRLRLLGSTLSSHLSREDQHCISILIPLSPAEYAVRREPQMA